ncbi:MAG: asparagine synthase (glutamine-hydrolyzing) [Hyphomicrobium sp.]|uniref:asparagine synthase (glutamine-hydrolyzing) n=1 Tax=Hyphomicrobium sp. TaxID=82 RepID=UPI0013224178|nr:asparagine synthase (glutamine-hydrolyzing) [Hyphomicrobium sp.]KAB2940291.1 MAG: asparagine synthase (glutamine-hydrolyzing) [Hyphomicrobium sp.]MBZ0211107.1 asparagine synthase (glutamine-hydrolyzing) [Hyphomicrobium sp.]
MCGIAGYYRIGVAPEQRRGLLARMIGRLAHRGPDGNGSYLDGDVGLAHARLSIIDVEGGRQPMCNEDGSVWITFNGEIFNYVELRAELIARGHVFKTTSDTEVIVHLYEERGPECVEALNGDFAFAIWDSRQQRLVLARDRVGVRPLYYAVREGALAFASEVKALLEVPGISAALDPIALDQMFTFWFPLAPRTPFKDIAELPPAHVLVATREGISTKRYWRFEYPDAGEDRPVTPAEEARLTEEVRALLLDAVRIRLRADVPIGAYLSGGLDSSITTAAIRSFVPDQLRSFSVAFESAEFDESLYQEEMVAALELRHSVTLCRDADIAGVLPELIRHTERPIMRTAPAPMLMLSRLVRDSGFKVVMTGEGADEVFAGYDVFKEAKVRRFCAAQPSSKLRPLLLRKLYPYMPRLQSQSQRYLEAFFGGQQGTLDDPLYSHLPRFRTSAGAKGFFSSDLRAEIGSYDALAEMRDQLPAEFARWHPLSQSQYLESAYLLPGYILSSQGDRVGMANAVEGRFPFLDHRLIELAARIPPRLKLKGLVEKHILRQSVKDLLPDVIAKRPKQPYRAPESRAFLRSRVGAAVLDHMSRANVSDAGYFDAGLVARLVEKCDKLASTGFRDNLAFVGILSTQVWHDAFVAGAPGNHGIAIASPSQDWRSQAGAASATPAGP